MIWHEEKSYNPKYKVGDRLVQEKHGDLLITKVYFNPNHKYLNGWKYLADVIFKEGRKPGLEFHAFL